MARMHNPPHSGEVLRDTVLRRGGGLSVTEFAKRLGVSPVALSRVVNGRAAVSAELAIRLAAALGGSAESWLRMQVSYDLRQAQRRRRPKIRPLESRELDRAALGATRSLNLNLGIYAGWPLWAAAAFAAKRSCELTKTCPKFQYPCSPCDRSRARREQAAHVT
jgi:antitoxin HigA-1